ncbi:hypothetical protein B0H13DRAFT_1887136 [Mycena leptocephala]|nr:hypothetical protein B0H13DRAFT_1887136 [Mycena leptocephala]
MFWFFLLGTLLAFYGSNSVFLVSLTNSEIRLGLPLERSNLAERMKDPDILTCPCEASYRSESHFTRHQNNCERLLDASHRAWDVADSRQIKGPNLAQRDLRRSPRKDGNDRARDTGQAFVVRRTHWPRRRLRPTTEMTGLSPAHLLLLRLHPRFQMVLWRPSDLADDIKDSHLRTLTPAPPTPSGVEEPLPAKRIRRPIAKALQALEDVLLEEPGPLEEDATNADNPEPEP